MIEIPTAHSHRSSAPRRLARPAHAGRHRLAPRGGGWGRRGVSSGHPPPAPQAKPLADAIRKHGSIENRPHGVLDIAFDEGSRRQQDRNGSANLATLRRLTLTLLHEDTSMKRGIKAKRFACPLEPDDLLQIFQQSKIGA